MDNLHPFLYEKGGKIFLKIALAPQSKRAGVLGLHGESIKIAVKAPPVDGKANQALIDFLAMLFVCPKRNITLERGQSSRNKLISLLDLDKARVLGILERLLSDA